MSGTELELGDGGGRAAQREGHLEIGLGKKKDV